MALRSVKRLIKAKPTLEGAGVRLRRAFGFGATTDYDPFLLLDDFRNERPEDYLPGFPWHPHRGIETITYVLAGTVEHGDSIGNRGTIGAGDIQWMTAGRGIIHQEMPKGDARGRMHGFQLWLNIPAALKMTAPRYQEVKAADIPVVAEGDGSQVRVVCGRYHETPGPVRGRPVPGPVPEDVRSAKRGGAGGTVTDPDPVYLDISVPAGKRKSFAVEAGRNAFAYVFEGAGKFCNAAGPLAVPS